MRIAWVYGAVFAVACVVASSAEAKPREFTPGEIVPQGGGQFLKILQCGIPEGKIFPQCEVHAVENGRKSSNTFWWDYEQIVKAEQRAFEEDPSLRKTAPAPAPAPRAPAQRAPKPEAAAPGANAACPRTPYGGPVSGATSASDDLFKRKVADNYTMKTRDPYWYGVTFESFSVGAPIKNTVSNQPGVGAVRVNNGAPPNATMYPVTSRHVVCEGAPTSSERYRVQSKYLCFVSRDNEWTCGGDGAPKITPLP